MCGVISAQVVTTTIRRPLGRNNCDLSFGDSAGNEGEFEEEFGLLYFTF